MNRERERERERLNLYMYHLSVDDFVHQFVASLYVEHVIPSDVCVRNKEGDSHIYR